MSINASHTACGVAVDKDSRELNDFYSTPPEAVEALLSVESFKGDIWEPACGKGHISKVLISHGYEVISTDLVDRGYGEPRIDFLMEYKGRAPNIITNPPFKNATDFIRKALELSTGKVAMLMRLQALEGLERRKLFESSPLKAVYVFSGRITMLRNDEAVKSSGMMATAWFLWSHGYDGKPTIGWL